MLALDLEKAIDTVWQEALIHKLIQANLPTEPIKLVKTTLKTDKTLIPGIQNLHSEQQQGYRKEVP